MLNLFKQSIWFNKNIVINNQQEINEWIIYDEQNYNYQLLMDEINKKVVEPGDTDLETNIEAGYDGRDTIEEI